MSLCPVHNLLQPCFECIKQEQIPIHHTTYVPEARSGCVYASGCDLPMHCKEKGKCRGDSPDEIPAFLKSNPAPKQETSILDEAKRIIYGDREKTYGSPDKNLRTIAELWNSYLRSLGNQMQPLSANDVCLMMILLKVARLANDPTHQDSQVDLAGYTALMERIQKMSKS